MEFWKCRHMTWKQGKHQLDTLTWIRGCFQTKHQHSNIIWKILKKVLSGCVAIFSASHILSPILFLLYNTHNSSQTDELWTEHRGVSEAANRNHYTVEAVPRDTWEFTNMSFLPCLLGVHCELLNLLHGKTPNVWQKMGSWPLICLFER